MSDQEKKQETIITPQPNAEKKESGELSEEEMKTVTGGTPLYLTFQFKMVTVKT
jgi:bacteriocin-like protein